ncbi:DUF1707 SHOCT-like domain-containing protein [Pseudonocardia sp. TRM90224]|uniref:DUF1707 SHOCT-like domain-containing protein n=1 Tax=Pseudonocardia sp. TRM90224 TaxID=2812678 RepID=UPI001E5F757B|nr:DUF1707 domain-containing protein [Pseudonocardia sp. TRM90224]
MPASDSPSSQPSRPIRAGDAEREDTARQLHDAFVEGRLTVDEFSERMRIAAGALHRGDLADLLADLPGTELLALDAPRSTEVATGRGSDVAMGAGWLVPSTVVVQRLIGDTVLDLAAARLTRVLTHVRVDVRVGNLLMIVAPDTGVDTAGLRVRVGGVRHQRGSGSTAQVHHIVVTGQVGAGIVRVMRPDAVFARLHRRTSGRRTSGRRTTD